MTVNRIQPKVFVGIAFVLIFALYGVERAKHFLSGPELVITYPADGMTSTSSAIAVRGTARNISMLYLNGGQIFTDEAGLFSKRLLLAPGYTILEVRAEDRFDRVEREVRAVVYRQHADPEKDISKERSPHGNSERAQGY